MSKTTGEESKNEQFLDSVVHELQAMSDTDALEGMNAEELARLGSRMFDSIKAEAGRRRLANAKAKLSIIPTNEHLANISVTDARRYLKTQAGSPSLTLAARNLDELSDDDVLHLYSQIKDLEGESTNEGS